MYEFWLGVFAAGMDPNSAALTFSGRREGAELVDGRLMAGPQTVADVVGGIVSFATDVKRWSESDVARLRERQVIPRAWDKAADRGRIPKLDEFCDELAAQPGAILEIAAGPGGGNMPGILQRNSQAKILANDASPDVLRLWQAFLRPRGVGANCCFAVFDARCMPLRDRSIAAVSSVSGFGNVEGWRTAVWEAHRVLIDGGFLYSCDLVIDADDFDRFPAELKMRWSGEEHETLTRGLTPALVQCGFQIVESLTEFHRKGDPAEDGVAERALEYGATFRWNREIIKAQKPTVRVQLA